MFDRRSHPLGAEAARLSHADGHGFRRPSERGRGGGFCLPSAAERLVELDHADRLVAHRLDQLELRIEQLTFGIQNFEIAGDTAFVPEVRDLAGVHQRPDEQLLLLTKLPSLAASLKSTLARSRPALKSVRVIAGSALNTPYGPKFEPLMVELPTPAKPEIVTCG